jgi:tight adherence protein B
VNPLDAISALAIRLDPMTVLLFSGAGFVFVTLMLLGGSLRRGAERRRFDRRLAHACGRAGNTEAGEIAQIRRETTNSAIPTFDRLIRRWLPHPNKLRRRIEQSGLVITVGSYVLINLVLALATIGLLRGAMDLNWALVLPLGVVLGAGLPQLVVGNSARLRIKRFVKLFPEAIDLIVRGLKSGLPVAESIAVVGREMSDPVGVEFRQIADAMRIGRTLEEALWTAARRLPLAEFKFFVIALSVQRETGGDLTATLENLSDILRRRQQMRLKIKALSSEAKASALIIGALPFVIFGVLTMLNPDYVMVLVDDPRGHVMLAAGFTWLGIGAAVMAKMVRFEI